MSIVSDLHEFISTCPHLEAEGGSDTPRIYVDYSGQNPTAYQLQIIPTIQTLTTYIDGTGEKQMNFYFRSQNYFDGRDIEVNIDNYLFFDKFSEWLEKTKPPEKFGWREVKAVTNGYFSGVNEGQDKAVYQIQCRVIYYF